MKRKYKDFLDGNLDNNIIIRSSKRRKLNNGNFMEIINNINSEIIFIKSDIKDIKSNLDIIKKKIEAIEIFIGMKYKKFDSNPSYIC